MWIKWKHTFNAGNDDVYSWEELGDLDPAAAKEYAKDFVAERRDEFNWSDNYRGVKYELVDKPPDDVLYKIIDDCEKRAAINIHRAEDLRKQIGIADEFIEEIAAKEDFGIYDDYKWDNIIADFITAFKVRGPFRYRRLFDVACMMGYDKPRYDPFYGDGILCANLECNHPYYRHFDTYDDMRNVGCKYCQCNDFIKPDTKEAKEQIEKIKGEGI